MEEITLLSKAAVLYANSNPTTQSWEVSLIANALCFCRAASALHDRRQGALSSEKFVRTGSRSLSLQGSRNEGCVVTCLRIFFFLFLLIG